MNTILILSVLLYTVASRDIQVGLKLKTAGHPLYYPNAVSSAYGFTIDGFEAPPLFWRTSEQQTFMVRTPCSHPFYLTSDPLGGYSDFTSATSKAIALGSTTDFVVEIVRADGSTSTNYADACEGANVTVTVKTANTALYYQSTIFPGVGGKIQVGAATEPSFYDLFPDTDLVATFAESFATGFFKPAFPSFTDAQALAMAPAKLKSLSWVLGYVAQGHAVENYTNSTDFEAIHAPLGLTSADLDNYANAVVLFIVDAFGLTENIDYIKSMLNSYMQTYRKTLCVSCRESLCDALSTTAQETVVTRLINKTMDTLSTASSPLRKYFDGTTSSKNYLSDTTAYQSLRYAHANILANVKYFNCTQFGVNNVDVEATIRTAHENLGIYNADYDRFMAVLVDSYNMNGLPQSQLRRIFQLLESFRSLVVTAANPLPQRTTYSVSLQPKTNAHPFFNVGDSQGFVVDGKEGPELSLVTGTTYVFSLDGSVTCDYDFYITSSSVGGSNSLGQNSTITVPFRGLVCNDTYGNAGFSSLTYTPVSAGTFYYQSRYKPAVGGKITVTTPVVATTAGSPTSTTGTPGTSATSTTSDSSSSTSAGTSTSGTPATSTTSVSSSSTSDSSSGTSAGIPPSSTGLRTVTSLILLGALVLFLLE